jgi:DNA-binding transcriptional regulator YhcF (GntR family)
MNMLPSINVESRVPRHLQAWWILLEAIRKGTFPRGTRLPDSREIAIRMKSSLVTTRRAIARLVKEGWLERNDSTFMVAAVILDSSLQIAPAPRVPVRLGPTDEQLSEREGEYELVGAR